MPQLTSALVLLCAGRGSRFAATDDSLLPPQQRKQFLLLRGLPIFVHSLFAFATLPFLKQLIFVVNSADRSQLIALLKQFFKAALQKTRQQQKRLSLPLNSLFASYAALKRGSYFVAGGSERCYSVLNGLKAVSEELAFVFIHDAARPLLAAQDLHQLFKALQNPLPVGVLPVAPAKDSIKVVNPAGYVTGSLPRQSVRLAATPQAFPRRQLVAAYQAFFDTPAPPAALPTDDSEVYAAAGHPVLCHPLKSENPKLTTAADWPLLETLAQQREETAV